MSDTPPEVDTKMSDTPPEVDAKLSDTSMKVDCEQVLPKLVVFNDCTKTVEHVTSSKLAMRVAKFTTVHTHETESITGLSLLPPFDRTDLGHNTVLRSGTPTTIAPGVSVFSSSDSTFLTSCTASTASSTSPLISSVAQTVVTTPNISVRSSSTVATMVTTTRTSTHCQFHGEFTSSNRASKQKNASVTYCYCDPASHVLKPKVNKIPHKVVGRRYLDEKKFVRFIWHRIKDLDFPLALAEIIEHLRRIDQRGIGVQRDRLITKLKCMVQSKRRKLQPVAPNPAFRAGAVC